MNGILLVDKPEGWTSHDVVAKLRGVYHERRAGHSGTLDPMATGLLVVFFGRATRAVEFAEADVKEYVAGIRFGISTDTQDTTGNILSTASVEFDSVQLENALAEFRGDILQIPPMYSAIKVNGKKLYEIARKGETVERKARGVHIYSLDCAGNIGEDMELRVKCSKGTYIRTLCHDLGRSLGCGAAMSALRRTSAGIFNIEQAHSMDIILEAAADGRAEELILPVDTLFNDRAELMLTAAQEKCVRNGGTFSSNMPKAEYRAYSKSGEFIGLLRQSGGIMSCLKSFFEV